MKLVLCDRDPGCFGPQDYTVEWGWLLPDGTVQRWGYGTPEYVAEMIKDLKEDGHEPEIEDRRKTRTQAG